MRSRIFGIVGNGVHEVTATLSCGDGGLRIEGVPPARARTQADRVRAAIRASGLVLPHGRVVVRVAPEVRGQGTPLLDLPIALALVGLTEPIHRSAMAWGRLTLDGRLRAWRDGTTVWTPAVAPITCKRAGWDLACVLSVRNLGEARCATSTTDGCWRDEAHTDLP